MASTSLWRRRSFRRNAIQTGFVALIALVAVTGFLTARSNLATMGLSSGFGFLWNAAGWEINFSLIGAEPADPYWWLLLNGIVNTLFLGVIGLFFATVIGLVVGLARSSSNASARLLGSVYVEIFRNIPLIVQVFFWYAASTRLPNPRQAWQVGEVFVTARGIYLPGLNVTGASAAIAIAVVAVTLMTAFWIAVARRFNKLAPPARSLRVLGTIALGLLAALAALAYGRLPQTDLVNHPALQGLNIRGGIRIQPELYALAFAIAIYGGAYIGEIVRGGFNAVGRGQVEAGQALGLTAWQAFARIRMPLATRAMLPILINQYVWLIKATTLGITVGFSDFFMIVAGSITHSGQTLEFIAILMGGFLVINFSLAAVLNKVNRAIALKGNQNGAAQ